MWLPAPVISPELETQTGEGSTYACHHVDFFFYLALMVYTDCYGLLNLKDSHYKFAGHCESGEGLWLEGEAAVQTHRFRDADP